MAGKGGGAWKVAYADFVTAMMAFFMVMWLTAQDKSVKEAVAQYFEDPTGNNRGVRSTSLKGPHDSITIGLHEGGLGRGKGLALGELRSTTAPLNPRGVAAVLPPRMEINRDRYDSRSLGTIATFADSSAELDEGSKKRLKLMIPMLAGKFNQVEIRGYIPRRPLKPESTFKDGGELSYARCLATRNYLIECGLEPSRLLMSQDGRQEPVLDEVIDDVEQKFYSVEVFATDVIVN
jgi:chemotaxis protein MotB